MGSDPRPNTMLLTSNVVAVSKRSLSIGSSTMCCRMAPSKNVRCGRPLRHSPVATRSRAAASRASVARLSMGHIVQHLDDEPAHQQAVHPVVGAAAGRRGTTEERLSSMERRLEASDKMLQEVHAMVRGLQQLPATNALPALPPTAYAGGEPIAPPLANQVGWHHMRQALHQAPFQDQRQPHGQRPYLQVSIQAMKYTLSPGHPEI